MAKRYKPKVIPIKSSVTIPVEKGRLHRCVLIQRGTYWDIKCHTCGRGTICGGDGGDKLLRQWAEWHASKVEVYEVDPDSEEKVGVPWR